MENNLEQTELSAEEVEDHQATPLIKVKRVRSAKQIESLEKARLTRQQNKIIKDKNTKEVNREAEKIVLNKKSKKIKDDEEEDEIRMEIERQVRLSRSSGGTKPSPPSKPDDSSDSESEEEVEIVKKKKKNKQPKKKRVIVEESSSSDDDELLPSPSPAVNRQSQNKIIFT